MIHTLKDFLPEDLSCRMRDILMGDSFPYFYRDGVSYEGDNNYCFGHTLFNDDDDYPEDCIINPDYSKLFNSKYPLSSVDVPFCSSSTKTSTPKRGSFWLLVIVPEIVCCACETKDNPIQRIVKSFLN